jgi:glycosyltransferase involved in cell wall biosynthesis
VNVATAQIIEEGLPRTDRQFLDRAGRSEVRARLRREGLELAETDRIVLYAPTWRGSSFHAPHDDPGEILTQAAHLERLLPPRHRVLVKVHQQVARAIGRELVAKGRLVPNDLPTNVLLGVVDVLVTDYSSIMFDFLSTGRPVVLFTPDIDEYQNLRGLYLDPSDLPGPIVRTVEELATVLGAVGSATARDPQVTHGRAYAAARKRFAPHDDGSVTERVLDIVLRGETKRRVRPAKRDGRATLLIHPGGLMTNGITSSALNLLHAIDHDAFDVSIVRNHSVVRERAANVARIDSRVRQFVRIGGMPMSKRSYLARRRLLSGRGASLSAGTRDRLDALLREEWSRTVGQTSFDYLVDFGGYSPLWAHLIANAPAGSRSIWLHNDLKADQMRSVNGRYPHEQNLRGVFSTYRRFDHLVSVSPALRDVNAQRLGDWAPAERFIAARNVIDHERVLASAQVLPDEAIRRFTSESFTFVTVGRLSPEKNHLRLVEAFALLSREYPDARLVIIGDGPTRPAVSKRATELGVQGDVRFTGSLANPWAVMAGCDCFVMSSDYEGQPMTILEARTLGLPVVTTAFDSVRSAVTGAEGLVTERSVEGLAAGMGAGLRGAVPQLPFDPAAYNHVVLQEFYRAIGAELS